MRPGWASRPRASREEKAAYQRLLADPAGVAAALRPVPGCAPPPRRCGLVDLAGGGAPAPAGGDGGPAEGSLRPRFARSPSSSGCSTGSGWRCAHRAREHGIELLGDLPIYVDLDSADVWWHRRLFRVDEDGRPEAVAGVPPDYFSAEGQLWGNPLYDWDAMRADGFRWWVDRVRAQLRWFDYLRIDHFRGLRGLLAGPGRRQQRPGRVLATRARRGVAGCPGRRLRRPAVPGRGSRHDHTGGARASPAVRAAGHADRPVRLRRVRRQSLPPGESGRGRRDLFGNPRQRHGSRLVPRASMRVPGTTSTGCWAVVPTTCPDALLRSVWAVAGRGRDLPPAGSPGPGLGGPDEHARRPSPGTGPGASAGTRCRPDWRPSAGAGAGNRAAQPPEEAADPGPGGGRSAAVAREARVERLVERRLVPPGKVLGHAVLLEGGPQFRLPVPGQHLTDRPGQPGRRRRA